jgi:hypothetical protein
LKAKREITSPVSWNEMADEVLHPLGFAVAASDSSSTGDPETRTENFHSGQQS